MELSYIRDLIYFADEYGNFEAKHQETWGNYVMNALNDIEKTKEKISQLQLKNEKIIKDVKQLKEDIKVYFK